MRFEPDRLFYLIIMARKITNDIIIDEFIGVNGDRYDYSLVEYVSTHEKIKIICKEHGIFTQTPAHHKRGKNCPKCNPYKKLTQEEFIKKCLLIHGDKYDYSLVEYKNSNTRIYITCKIHGVFNQKPKDHIANGGCSKCGSIKRVLNKKINTNKRRNWSFKQPDDYKLIPLTRGEFAKVDNDIFDKVKDINWIYDLRGYSCNRKSNILMHRFIVNCPDGMHVDHINHDTLDNRKANLRICTPSQNAMNARSNSPNKTSIYKGVSWSKKYDKWICQIVRDKKLQHRSKHEDEVDAAKTYDKKAKELFGEFAYLNFR